MKKKKKEKFHLFHYTRNMNHDAIIKYDYLPISCDPKIKSWAFQSNRRLTHYPAPNHLVMSMISRGESLQKKTTKTQHSRG